MASILEKLGHKAVMIDVTELQPSKARPFRKSTN